MFGRIAVRGMGRSGCSLSWLAVYCQPLISPHSARKCPLQYSSRQIRRLPHLNLALGSSGPQPPNPPTLSGPHGPSLFSPPPGVCWDAPLELGISRLQPPGPRAGEGQIKALRGSVLLSPRAHLKSASQRGCVVPSLRLPYSYPSFTH